MAYRYVESLLWLAGCTGVGYGLLLVLTPKEDYFKKDIPGLEPRAETLSKKEKFVNILQAAANSNQPLYRMNKEGIDKELKK